MSPIRKLRMRKEDIYQLLEKEQDKENAPEDTFEYVLCALGRSNPTVLMVFISHKGVQRSFQKETGADR